MSCLATKTCTIIIAVLMIILSIGVMIASNSYYWLRYDPLIKHANLLQIIASIILAVGVIKNNHRLMVPWMITSSLLAYFILSVAIDVPGILYGIDLICFMSALVATLLFYAFGMYVIWNYFQELRKSMDNLCLFTSVPSNSTSTSTLDIKTA